jgi:superfamily II DNA or RNA helicase
MAQDGRLNNWLPSVDYWFIDEGHHVVQGNTWGNVVELFRPDSYGLTPTATPNRADKKGLGRHASGYVDEMVLGLDMQSLVALGRLSPTEIFIPESDYHRENLKITGSNEFSAKSLTLEAKRSHVYGDIVQKYLELAPGKRGITFMESIESCEVVAGRFNNAGVPALALSSKTPELVRAEGLRRFEAGEVLQLVNVDLFGEGYDCPAVEAVSFGAATNSFGRYSQRYGRGVRVMPGKTHGTIIDHVGDCISHSGPPDTHRNWSLDNGDKRESAGREPVKRCTACSRPYDRALPACPFCGWDPVPVERSTPEQVDGDLVLLDEAVLNALRKSVSKLDADPESVRSQVAYAAGPMAADKAAKDQKKKQAAQANLREGIALWAGRHQLAGAGDREINKRFFLQFKTSILEAKALPRREADELALKIAKGL